MPGGLGACRDRIPSSSRRTGHVALLCRGARCFLLRAGPGPRSRRRSSAERHWGPAHVAFSSLQMRPRERLGSYRNALLPLLAGTLNSRGYCGRSPISLRSQKMEVIPQTCMLLVTNAALRPWPLSLVCAQVQTKQPLPALAEDDAVENPTKRLENPGHVPGVALPARAWHHGGRYLAGRGFGCSPSPSLPQPSLRLCCIPLGGGYSNPWVTSHVCFMRVPR